MHRLDASDQALPPDPFRASTHHVSLAETVELARAIGRLPGRTVVYGIEGGSFAVGAPLTPAVAAAALDVAAAVRGEVCRRWYRPSASADILLRATSHL